MKKMMLFLMTITFGASTLCVEQQDGLEAVQPHKTFSEKVAACYAKTKQTLWNHRYKILAVTSVVALAGLAYWYKATIAAFLGYDLAKAEGESQSVAHENLPINATPETPVQPVKPVLTPAPDGTSHDEPVLESEAAKAPETNVNPEQTTIPAENNNGNAAPVTLPEPVATTTSQSVQTDIQGEEPAQDTTMASKSETTVLPEAKAVENNTQLSTEAEPVKAAQSAEDIPAMRTPETQPTPAVETPTVSVPDQESLPTETIVSDPVPSTTVIPSMPTSAELSPETKSLGVNSEDPNSVEKHVLESQKRLQNVVDEKAAAENLP